MDKMKEIWKGDIFVNHGSQRACSVALLLIEGTVENTKQVNGKGRLLIIEFEYVSKK